MPQKFFAILRTEHPVSRGLREYIIRNFADFKKPAFDVTMVSAAGYASLPREQESCSREIDVVAESI